MKTSKQVGELMSALAVAQGEFGEFETNKQGYNFKYLNLAGILKVITPALSKNNLALTQESSFRVKNEMPYVSVLTRIYYKNEWIEHFLDFTLIEPSRKTDTDIAMLGSSISYLRRYAIQSMLGIAGTDKEVEEIAKENENGMD